MKNSKIPTVYIMGNNRPSLYIGVTSNPIKRVWLHKNDLTKGFTNKYQLHNLLYYETFETMEQAILREKQLKRWHREWKLNLIKSKNPEVKDLYSDLIDAETSSA